MRRSDRKIKDRQQIDSIVNRATVCRLGMTDGKIPYIVPMNFGYDGRNLYFHSAREGRKIDLIRKNNNVCFEIDEEPLIIKSEKNCVWTAKYTSVMGEGKAQLIDNSYDKLKSMDMIVSSYSEEIHDLSLKAMDKIIIIKLKIKKITCKKS